MNKKYLEYVNIRQGTDSQARFSNGNTRLPQGEAVPAVPQRGGERPVAMSEPSAFLFKAKAAGLFPSRLRQGAGEGSPHLSGRWGPSAPSATFQEIYGAMSQMRHALRAI